MSDSMVSLLGQVLLHSLWQGFAVFALMAIGLRLLANAGAEKRFQLLALGLVLLLAAPVITVAWVDVPAHEVASAPARTTGATSIATSPISSIPAAGPASPAPVGLLPILVAIWLAGVGVGVARLAGAWILIGRLLRDAVPADPDLVRRARDIASRTGVTRAVRYLVSQSVKIPFTRGIILPVIVLPVSMLSGLSPAQVDAILTHELAHIRRYDYLVSLLQRAAETLLFFHPVTWWLSHRISVEREYCCDDVAAAGTDPVLYAQALLDLEGLRSRAPLLGLAATGSGSLHDRIERLLAPARHESRDDGITMLAVLVAAALVSGIAGQRSVAEAQDPGPVHQADKAAAFEARWSWATDRARSRGDRGYVVGWRVEARAQSGNLVISSTDGTSRREGGVRVADLVGKADRVRGPADGVAILVGMSPGSDQPQSVRLRSMNATVVPDGRGVYWLGTATDAESVTRIKALLAAGGASRVRAELGAALSLHDDAVALPAIGEILSQESDEQVRAETAAWLGGSAWSPGVERLLRNALNDSSASVRDEAVSALSGPGEKAFPLFLSLIEHSPWEDVRSEAVQALGDVTPPAQRGRAAELLRQVARNYRSREVRREAWDQLFELEGGR